MNYNSKLSELLQDAKTWSDLKTKLEDFNTSQTETSSKKTTAGKLFEYFAKYYFIVNPEYSQLYSKAWLFEEIPTEIKIKLNFPDRDFGIDLLLQDNQNRFTAVQCKFKNNEDYILKWKRDSIAHPFALADNCERVMIFTNATGCVSEIEKREKFNQISIGQLIDISIELLQDIKLFIGTNVIKPIVKFPRLPHQVTAINKTIDYFQTNDRAQLILPCGAGKTLAALWIKEDMQSRNTLILFPSLALLRQFKTEWANQRAQDYVYINVCSEKDIDISAEDSTVTHTYEISGEVTTSPERIFDFLSTSDKSKIVFCTYQSIEAVEKALHLYSNFYFDLIICDEAHRTAGPKANTFAIVHDQTRIKGRKRLYMTATPKVVSNSLKAKLGENYELLCDMSKTEIFGDEAYRMSFGEAIQQNILVDYKIIGIGVTHKQVKEFIEKRRYVTEKYDMKEIADNYALDIVMDKYSANHAITFHSRVAFADDFAKRHNNFFAPDVYAQHVSGQNTTSRRAKVLTEFKLHRKGVVSNARCLTEGVDVPIIDLIYFCDPKNSKIDIVQASGRALRKDKHGKKPIGYIVVPIYHHIDEDIEMEIEKKPYFQNLIQVIRSLCDQDERLQAEIDEVAFNKGEKTFRRIEIAYDDSTIEKIIKLDGLDREVKKYLFDQIIEKTKDNWNVMYSNLVEFKKLYNTTNVTRKYKGYDTLRWWVQAQRDNYYKKRLSSLQIKKLNKINFEWKGEQRIDYLPPNEKWKKNYGKLKLYYDEHGNTDIPARYKKDKPLANWVVDQRVRYDNGRFSDEQIELLEAVNINWDPKNTYPEFLEALVEYKNQFGTSRVPQGVYEYRKLAAKSSRIRSIYRYGKETQKGDFVLSGKGRLIKWAIEKLNELNFEWDISNPEWDERFEEVKAFYRENGYSNIKSSDNQTLFQWCYNQRRNKKELSPEQTEKLKSIQFDFGLNIANSENTFLNRLSQLQEYKKTNGSFLISEKDTKNKPLKYWLGKLRTKYNKGLLPKNWEDTLQQIGYSFDDYEESLWNEKMSALKNFYSEYETFILFDKPGFESLNRWLQLQRKFYKQGKLSPDKIEQLISLGYSFTKNYTYVTETAKENIRNTFWNKKIEQVKSFLQVNDSLTGIENKQEYLSLYKWIKKVKTLNKKNQLSEGKKNQLIELNFDFDYKPIVVKKEKPNNWQQRFDELKTFFAETGSFNLSFKDEQQKPLASWLRAQKSLYKQGRFEEKRIKQLLSLGFSFTENYRLISKAKKKEVNEEKWNEKLEQFKEYYHKTGSFYILRNDKQNEKLRIWIQSQIANYRKEKLTDNKIEMLASIDFKFEANQITKAKPVKPLKEKKDKADFWNNQYLALIEYKIKNGNCNVPRNHENVSLSNWVSEQRSNYNRNRLTEDKVTKLNLLGFDWSNRKSESEKELWLKSYNKLKKFYEQFGHSSPNVSYGDKQLISWTMQQRHRRKIDKLKQDYFSLLELIEFNWTPDPNGGIPKPKDDIWLQHFQKLIQYKEQFGTTNVSQSNKDYKALGKWVNDQRHNCKKGKLSEFRINKLNEIGFVWDARKQAVTV